MRLIDADALLNGFDVHWVTEYDEAGFSMEYKAVPVGAIENAPTIDAMPKWISVKDAMPKNEKPVLIATKWSLMGMRGMAVSCGIHTDGKTYTGDSDYNWSDGDADLVYDEDEDEYIVPEGWWESVRYTEQFSAVDEPVLYWMPLPEPPKEDE